MPTAAIVAGSSSVFKPRCNFCLGDNGAGWLFISHVVIWDYSQHPLLHLLVQLFLRHFFRRQPDCYGRYRGRHCNTASNGFDSGVSEAGAFEAVQSDMPLAEIFTL